MERAESFKVPTKRLIGDEGEAERLSELGDRVVIVVDDEGDMGAGLMR